MRQITTWTRIDHTDGSCVMVPRTRGVADGWTDREHQAIAQHIADALAAYVRREQLDRFLRAYRRLENVPT
jgi:hypothetical protein